MRLAPIGLQIRPMLESDYQAVFRLYRRLVGKINHCEADFARIFQHFFEDIDREAFVADVHSKVIGFVTLYYLEVFHQGGYVASIQELIITEEFRGRGVGRSLMEFVKQKSREKECRGLEVATDLLGRDAQLFYQRCGWRSKKCLAAN